MVLHRNPVTTVINVITSIVVGVIVLGIVLIWADANRGNVLVDLILDFASWLTTPFHGMFTPDNGELAVLFNWGLAALVYWGIGSLLAYATRRRAVVA
ncbi:hypothetical protein [Actinocorallia aurantiaca]|uniref:ABC-2 type transport system permease protein n=1 Tax=Actinocorallia aurantiaca TaxID=46204 RepID=A0ABN3UHW2_9ACTN